MITKLMNILTPEAIYGLICATVFCVIFAVAGKARHAQHYTFSQGVVLVLFLLYLWQVWMFTGVGTLSNVLAGKGKFPLSGLMRSVNLLPFQSLGTSFFLNIVMCLPLGFLIPFLWKNFRRFWKVGLMGLLLSLLTETSQLFNFRTSDVDDLIANIASTLLGYGIWKLCNLVFGERLRKSRNSQAEAVVYLLLSFAGIFLLYNESWFANFLL